MSTLTVTLSDEQVNRYSLQGTQSVSMNILIDRIKNEMAKDALRRCQEIAVETGLATLSASEIDAEIRAVRTARKG